MAQLSVQQKYKTVCKAHLKKMLVIFKIDSVAAKNMQTRLFSKISNGVSIAGKVPC